MAMKTELETEATIMSLCPHRERELIKFYQLLWHNIFSQKNMKEKLWWDEYQMKKKASFGNNEYFTYDIKIFRESNGSNN